MDLNQLLYTLRRHWLIAVLAFAVVFGVGLAAAFVPKKQYEATASVLVSPNPKSDPNAAFQAVTVGLPQLGAKATSSTFANRVYRTLPEALTQTDTSVSSTTSPDSGVLTITAKGTVPAATAPIANAYAKTLLSTEPADSFVSLSILDRAAVPTSPSSPVKGPILVGAFVLGLIVALLAALFTGALARRRRRADELRSQLGASVLAEVPAAPARVRATDRLWATLTPAEAPGLVEALQQLRANFELTLPHTGDSFVVAITSPGDGDGKSTIAANLAWLLASVGHDVALIDADLRRPALGRMFRQTTGPGLSAGAHTDVSMLLQPTHMSTLSFIPSGVPDRHPAEVIATALPKVLQGLRSRHGIIIVDAPPLGTVAETATIASITGAAILVIDTRQRDPEEIEHAVLELQDRGARLFGIVLNRVRGTRPTSPYALGTSGDRQSRKAITTNGQGTSPSDARAFEPGPH